MNDERSFERLLADRMEVERGSAQLPDSFYDDFRRRASGRRQRPRWLALIKEPPMRYSRTLAVGSPTARVAAIVVATLLLALMLAGVGIAGSRLFAADGNIVVAQDGSGTVTTITDAVALAEDGDTILVRPGTYDEAVVLDRDVTIRGDGDRDEVVVELSLEMPPLISDNHPDLTAAFLIEGADATIENLTVRGESSRIVINGGAPELRNLVLDGIGRVYDLDPGSGAVPTGLLIEGGSTALIENSVLTDTDTDILSGSSPTLLGNEITIGAIYIDGAGVPVIQENTIDASVKWGIAIGDARPEVVANIIVAADVGIDVWGTGTDATLRGNAISASKSQGISVVEGAEATVENNMLTDNNIGISTSSSDATVVGNTVSGGGVGISIVGGSPTLEANEVAGAERGLVIGFGTTPTLEGNTVCGNTTNLEVNMPEEAEMPDTTGNEICADPSE